jgi:Flp pilus assembly pilin Flp
MMNLIKTTTSAIRNDRRAVGAIEYALLASFLLLGIIIGATTLGHDIGTYFSNLGAAVALWHTASF